MRAFGVVTNLCGSLWWLLQLGSAQIDTILKLAVCVQTNNTWKQGYVAGIHVQKNQLQLEAVALDYI